MPFQLPRYQRSTRVAGRGPDPNAGAAEQSLADVLTNFSFEQASNFAQAGVEDAAAEGLAAGFESDDLPQASELTAAGRAFNDAAELAHLSNIRLDIKTKISELAIQAGTLPAEQWVEAFQTTSDGYRDGLLEEINPRFRGEAMGYFADLASTARLKLLDGQQTQLQQQTIADLQIGRRSLLDDISTAARELDENQLTMRQREFETQVERAVTAGYMTEAQGEAEVQAMHSKAVQNEILGAFDLVLEEQGIEAGGAALERLRNAEPSELGLSAEEKDQVETAALTEWNRERGIQSATRTRETAAEKAAKAVLKRQTSDAIDILNDGRSPSVDITALQQQLIDAEDFNSLLELQSAVRTNAAMAELRHLRPNEQRSIVESLEAAPSLTGEENRLLEALDVAQRHNQALLESDPRTLAIEQDIIEDTDLDFSSIEAFGASMANRIPGADMATQHYDTSVPTVTDAEADRIGRFWATQDVEGQLAIATGIASGLGPRAGEVLQAIDSKDYRTLAYAGGLVSAGLPDAGEAVLRGQAFLAADGGAELLPKGAELASLNGHINERLGTAYQFAPVSRDTAIQAVMAWYADRSQIHGDFTQEFSRDQRRRVDAAIQEVIGNLVEDRTGGMSPLRQGNQDQFDDWIGSIDDRTVIKAGGLAGFEDAPGEAALQIQDARLVAVADGVFRVALENTVDGLPAFAQTLDGRPFELRFEAR